MDQTKWLEANLDDLTVYSTDGTESWDMNAEGGPLECLEELILFVIQLSDVGYIADERLGGAVIAILQASELGYSSVAIV